MSSFPVENAEKRAPETAILAWKELQSSFPKSYGSLVNRYLSWCFDRKTEVDANSLKAFLSYATGKGASASYVNGYFYACKAFFLAWHEVLTREVPRLQAEVTGWALDQALKRVKLPKVVRGKRAKMVKELRAEQLDRVIRGASAKNSCIIEFLADSGVRVSEMTGIRLKDIRPWSEKDGFSYVTIVGKGDKERVIPVQNTILERTRKTYQGKTYLFETRTGRPLNPDNVYREVVRTFWRLEAIKLTPHNMRHYFATKHLGDGVSLKAVSEHLGHASPATTAVSYDVSTMKHANLRTKHHGDRGRKPKSGKELQSDGKAK